MHNLNYKWDCWIFGPNFFTFRHDPIELRIGTSRRIPNHRPHLQKRQRILLQQRSRQLLGLGLLLHLQLRLHSLLLITPASLLARCWRPTRSVPRRGKAPRRFCAANDDARGVPGHVFPHAPKNDASGSFPSDGRVHGRPRNPIFRTAPTSAAN